MERPYIEVFLVALVDFVALVCPVLAQTAIYVDDDAPVGGDGRLWGTVYRYLQNAILSHSDAVEDAQGAGAVKIVSRRARNQ